MHWSIDCMHAWAACVLIILSCCNNAVMHKVKGRPSRSFIIMFIHRKREDHQVTELSFPRWNSAVILDCRGTFSETVHRNIECNHHISLQGAARPLIVLQKAITHLKHLTPVSKLNQGLSQCITATDVK